MFKDSFFLIYICHLSFYHNYTTHTFETAPQIWYLHRMEFFFLCVLFHIQNTVRIQPFGGFLFVVFFTKFRNKKDLIQD